MERFQSPLDTIYNTYIEYKGKTYYVRSDVDYKFFIEMCLKEVEKNKQIELFGASKLLQRIKEDLKNLSSKLEERILQIERGSDGKI